MSSGASGGGRGGASSSGTTGEGRAGASGFGLDERERVGRVVLSLSLVSFLVPRGGMGGAALLCGGISLSSTFTGRTPVRRVQRVHVCIC